VQTRFADLDPLGHVNHVQYLVYMETARVRFMYEHGSTLRGHVLVARSECDHRREVPSSTREVLVTVYVERVGRTSFVVRHDLVDGDATVAVGRVTVVAVDEYHRPRPVTDAERAGLLGT
jgi:acyl-CoA thioester hydrolase